MHCSIRISGPAGLGINSLAEIVGSVTTNLGYRVISNIEYESRIKGGTNGFDIHVSDTDKSIRKTIDILLAFDVGAVIKSIDSLCNRGVIIMNSKLLEKLPSDVLQIIKFEDIKLLTLDIADKYENIYLLGVLAKFLGIDSDCVDEEIRKVFIGKGEETVQKNIDIMRNIGINYPIDQLYGVSFTKQKGAKNIFTYGNKMIAYGAIDSGLEYYSAYPMTPASSILTEVINSGKVPYLQAEDEIAVINSALGASFTGARAMVGTSGGGFALMSEAISFAAQAEFPIVIVLSQRAGPSTGAPTHHEQGDIYYALHPSFGEFGHVVVCPSTLEEGYQFSGLALNIAQKYQTIVILLTDKQFSESFVSVPEVLEPTIINRGKLLDSPNKDYKRYELTEDGISPYVRVGTKDGDFIATSYEHDEFGGTSEDPSVKILMTEKRGKKLENFFELENIFGYEIINDQAKRIIVTMSFNRYVAEDFIREHTEYGLLIVKFLLPVDMRMCEVLKGKDEVIFMENNYRGQIGGHLSSELGLNSFDGLEISHFRKYNLEPFYREDMEARFL